MDLEILKALMMLAFASTLLYGATRPIKRKNRFKDKPADEELELRRKIGRC